MPAFFKERIKCGINDCPYEGDEKTHMRATGVPIEVQLTMQLQRVEKRLEQVVEQSRTQAQRVIDVITETMREQPRLLRQSLLENFTIENVRPINHGDVQEIVQASTEALFNRLLPLLENAQARQNANPGEQALHAHGAEEEGDFSLFSWGGRIDHYVPSDYIYPSCPVRMIWNLWHHGDLTRRIRPLRHLRESDHIKDLTKKVHKVLCYKTEQVMKAMEQFATNNNIEFNVSTTEASDITFEKIFAPFMKSVFSDKLVIHRATTKSFATVANQIMKNRTPNADDDEESEDDSSSSNSDSDDDDSLQPRPSASASSSSSSSSSAAAPAPAATQHLRQQVPQVTAQSISESSSSRSPHTSSSSPQHRPQERQQHQQPPTATAKSTRRNRSPHASSSSSSSSSAAAVAVAAASNKRQRITAATMSTHQQPAATIEHPCCCRGLCSASRDPEAKLTTYTCSVSGEKAFGSCIDAQEPNDSRPCMRCKQ